MDNKKPFSIAILDTHSRAKILPDESVSSIIRTQIEFLGLQNKMVASFVPCVGYSSVGVAATIPDTAYNLVLVCSSNHIESLKIEDQLRLTKSTSSTAPTVTTRKVVATKKVFYAIVPKPEVLECLRAMRDVSLLLDSGLHTHEFNTSLLLSTIVSTALLSALVGVASLQARIGVECSATELTSKLDNKFVDVITYNEAIEKPEGAVHTWDAAVIDHHSPAKLETELVVLACDIRPNLWLVIRFLHDIASNK